MSRTVASLLSRTPAAPLFCTAASPLPPTAASSLSRRHLDATSCSTIVSGTTASQSPLSLSGIRPLYCSILAAALGLIVAITHSITAITCERFAAIPHVLLLSRTVALPLSGTGGIAAIWLHSDTATVFLYAQLHYCYHALQHGRSLSSPLFRTAAAPLPVA